MGWRRRARSPGPACGMSPEPTAERGCPPRLIRMRRWILAERGEWRQSALVARNREGQADALHFVHELGGVPGATNRARLVGDGLADVSRLDSGRPCVGWALPRRVTR